MVRRQLTLLWNPLVNKVLIKHFQIWLCFYFCYSKHFSNAYVHQNLKYMYLSNKKWYEDNKPLYEILCWISFLSNTFRFDSVNVLADVIIFLKFLHQRKHEMDITQQQKVIWGRLTPLMKSSVELGSYWSCKYFCWGKDFCISVSQENLMLYTSQQQNFVWGW